MEWTKRSSSEDDDLGSKVDVGDYYFYYNQTANYFPTMRFPPILSHSAMLKPTVFTFSGPRRK